jgi:uncharacterized membrane protein YphA (DoxX/SURF4 family)
MIAYAPVRPPLSRAAPWISTVLRLVLAGVLLAAGGLKAIDPQSSVAAVRAYQILPDALTTPVGWGLPFLEIALGLLLIAGMATRVVAAAVTLLMVLFVSAVGSAWYRGLNIDCGCFGGGGAVAGGETAYGGEIVRDLGFVLMGLWLVWQPQTKFALDEPGGSRRHE